MTDAATLHDKLHARLAQFARFGGTPEGGVHRPEATEANRDARRAFVEWLKAAGLEVRIDGIGNIFGLAALAGPDAPWVMTGSHLDSQPYGGRLDGTYGVLASTLAVETLVARHGAQRPAAVNFAVVSWTNEEGARYQPSVLGSQAYAGVFDYGWALDRVDGDGVRLRDALDAIGFLGTDMPAPRPAAFLELHIECGPLLERAGHRLGVFDRWWGCRKIELRFLGIPAHTGPTPMAERRDALVAAAELIGAVNALQHAFPDGALHCSVGRCAVKPNSPNVVPSEATLFVELRSPDPGVIADAHDRMQDAARAAADRQQVALEIRRDELRPAGRFSTDLQALAYAVAEGLGQSPMRLDTIAAHDAVPLARLCPSLVVATPSIGGICHAPDEDTAPEDLNLGFDLLYGMLERVLSHGLDGARNL